MKRGGWPAREEGGGGEGVRKGQGDRALGRSGGRGESRAGAGRGAWRGRVVYERGSDTFLLRYPAVSGSPWAVRTHLRRPWRGGPNRGRRYRGSEWYVEEGLEK